MDKLKMHTKSKVDINIESIGTLFPNTVTETIKGYDENNNAIIEKAIDFDILKQELSKVIVEGREERYQMNWPGKKEAILTANTPINKTLRPCREDSVNFDETENLYIEGDNLEVLKLLQETYLNRVKMIYIDPPYNKGNDSFVYNDNFQMSNEQFSEASGQYDEDGNLNYDIRKNNESNGKFHTDWLNMMYPRLKLAKDLLSDDGVIFISIDDNEVSNLKKVCDEIFGSVNFIAQLPTIMNLNGNNDSFGFVDTHEYTICYVKDKNQVEFGNLPMSKDELEKWDMDDIGYWKKADTLRRTGQDAARERRPKGWFPVFVTEDNKVYVTDNDEPINKDDLIIYPINENGEELSWTWSKKKIIEDNNNLIVIEGRSGKNIYKKQRPTEGHIPTKKPKSLLYKPEYSTSTATTKLKELLNKKIFDTPKPIPLIMDLATIAKSRNSIVLDFFSGSATTAHAVMKLNAEDGGCRKFIMVQLPEVTDEKSEARKAGYENICEIGKERIRRAGEKLVEENTEVADKLDIGFRVLKLDSSNMKDVYYSPNEYTQDMLSHLESNIKDDRTSEDLLFQVMLDLGELLSSNITEIDIDGKKVFNVGDGNIVACFNAEITNEVLTEIAKMQPLYAVFRDSSLSNDSVATNFEQIFKTYSPNTIKKVL